MNQRFNREIEVREFSTRHQTFVKVRSTPCRRCRRMRGEAESPKKDKNQNLSRELNFFIK